MNSHYNQNYTREEINAILEKIKSCVKKNRYVISLNENRQENIAFIEEYNIRSEKQRAILLQIEAEDFCYSLQNTNIGYEYEGEISPSSICFADNRSRGGSDENAEGFLRRMQER